MPAFQTQRFGNYVLTAHLGRGGMADVFRAQRTGVAGFERTVVIKRILKPYGEDPAFIEMFINEAKIAAHLTHPNIAQVYELGEVDGEYFMALEYVRGKDLLHLLRFLAKTSPERRALPPDVAAYVSREVLRGLSAAHDHTDQHGGPHPIVHRDVSPQNIMLAYDGQVKLVDFGIAKAMFSVREETRTGAIKGKIAYMSPEQVTGVSPGPESDIFAAGVVMYEMLVGRRLFKGQNDFETLNRVKSMTIPPPSRVASWVPHALDGVVLHALERDRNARYKRAAAMARDLDEYLQSARFTIENMHEYIAATLPAEVREEHADSPMRAPEPSMRSRSASSRSASQSPSGTPSQLPPGAPLAPEIETNPGTPHAREAHGHSHAPRGSGRRSMILAIGISLAVGVAGALTAVSLGSRSRSRDPLATSTPSSALPAPLDAGEVPLALHDEEPTPTRPAVAPEAKVEAKPEANVEAKPDVKSDSKIDAKADAKPPRVEALVDPNDPEDSPAEPSARHKSKASAASDEEPEPGEHGGHSSAHSTTGGKSTHPSGSHRPKIEVFDDSESPKPKIETFDD